MAQLRKTGALLKSLLLGSILIACNNEKSILPVEKANTTIGDQKAKISSLLKLTQYGKQSIQYVKTGKFKGKISYVDLGPNGGGYVKYSYDDNNPAGDLWITKRWYNQLNNVISEIRFTVVNGYCVLAEDPMTPQSGVFTYNAQGQLDEVKIIYNGKVEMTIKYFYDFNASSNSYRLSKILRTEVGLNYVNEYRFAYSSLPDYLPLNHEISPVVGIYDYMDRYLPIYGKFSDVLPSAHSITYDINSGPGPKTPHHFIHTYTTDSDGLVTLVETATAFGNNPPSANKIITSRTYSTAWQGI